jgi:hypothetical protein
MKQHNTKGGKPTPPDATAQDSGTLPAIGSVEYREAMDRRNAAFIAYLASVATYEATLAAKRAEKAAKLPRVTHFVWSEHARTRGVQSPQYVGFGAWPTVSPGKGASWVKPSTDNETTEDGRIIAYLPPNPNKPEKGNPGGKIAHFSGCAAILRNDAARYKSARASALDPTGFVVGFDTPQRTPSVRRVDPSAWHKGRIAPIAAPIGARLCGTQPAKGCRAKVAGMASAVCNRGPRKGARCSTLARCAHRRLPGCKHGASGIACNARTNGKGRTILATPMPEGKGSIAVASVKGWAAVRSDTRAEGSYALDTGPARGDTLGHRQSPAKAPEGPTNAPEGPRVISFAEALARGNAKRKREALGDAATTVPRTIPQ